MRFDIEDLHFSYGRNNLLSGLDLHLEPGKFTLLLGPNGCGKSTLLRLMTGELIPQQGKILLNEKNIRDYSGHERAVSLGVVLQSTAPALDFTVLEYVTMGRHARLSPFRPLSASDRTAVRNAMELLEVSHLAERPCNTLSGGERQRVMLASVFANEPGILLLDEPTSATDPAHTYSILELLHEHAAEKCVFMITHDLQLAGNFADRILLLKEGRIFADGSPEEVLTSENLQAVYDLKVRVEHTFDGSLMILPERRSGRMESKR